ncbi:MAG: RNA polymerase sigma factor [Clostridia bacterium]|nr:RNA polymerase sigma factor [Clostridia bacterium]
MLLFGLTSTGQKRDDAEGAVIKFPGSRADASSALPSELDSLIYSISSGSSRALAELYSITDRAVYGYALSILRNHHDAQDVMQETYIKIWQHAQNYTPRSKPMAWILTITRNLALSGLRRQKYNADIDDDRFNSIFDCNNDMLTADDRVTLESVLLRLKDDERQIVMLHCVAGLKHRETAKLLGMPLSTVLSKYNRSVKKLKNLLEAD